MGRSCCQMVERCCSRSRRPRAGTKLRLSCSRSTMEHGRRSLRAVAMPVIWPPGTSSMPCAARFWRCHSMRARAASKAARYHSTNTSLDRERRPTRPLNSRCRPVECSAYVPPVDVTVPRRTLMWVDRQGREDAIAAPPRSYDSPRLAPDGTGVALTVADSVNRDIWVWAFARGTLTRVTSIARSPRSRRGQPTAATSFSTVLIPEASRVCSARLQTEPAPPSDCSNRPGNSPTCTRYRQTAVE